MEPFCTPVGNLNKGTMTTNTHLADTDNLLLKFIHQNNVNKVKQLMTVDTVDINQLCYCWSNKSNISYSTTPLTLAVRFAGRRMVSALLSNKRVHNRRRADPNVECDLTPLGVAVEKDDPLLVALLLLAGANTQQATLKLASLDRIGRQSPKSDICLNHIRSAPVQIAIQNDHVHIVMLLQKAGDTNIGRSTGTTHHDSDKLRHKHENNWDEFRTVQSAHYGLEQLSRSTCGDKKSNLQKPPTSQRCKISGSKQWQLHRACALGDVDTAEDLLSRGMDANEPDGYGYSPIHYACITDQAQLIELLYINGADLDARSFEGKTALQTALEFDHLKAAYSLISNDCAIPPCVLNCQNSHGNTLLHIACKQNQTLVVRKLLASGASLDIVNKNGQTPIVYVWNTSSKHNLRESLFRDSLINLSREWGQLLYKAILCEIQVCSVNDRAKREIQNQCLLLCLQCKRISRHHAYELLKNKLLPYGNLHGTCCRCEIVLEAPPRHSQFCTFHGTSSHSHGGRIIKELQSERVRNTSPLHYVCEENETEIAMILINSDEDVNYVDSNGCTPLHSACKNGNEDLVNALLLHGARVNYADAKCNTPLHAACQKNRLGVARILLKAGADINCTNTDGYTCLHVACENRAEDIVRFLVNKRSPVNHSNSRRKKPWHAASFKIVRVILLDGAELADIDCVNGKGNTSLHIACNEGHANVVSILIDAGADVSRLNGDGNNCLHVACSKGHKSVVDIVLSKTAADVDCLNKNGNTSLHIACWKGFVDTVRILLNNGADVNRVGADGNTFLHVACATGHQDVVKLLINSGIDVNVLNRNGESPLRCAFDNDKYFLVSWMISSTSVTVSEDILCGFSKKRKTLLQMLYESNVDKATILNFIDNGIRINVLEENSSSGCDDSSKCLFSYVRKYGLSFAKNLLEHGLLVCSRKCLLRTDYVHQRRQTTHFVRLEYPLQDICRWWTWLTHSGVHLSYLELAALQEADTRKALPMTELQWLQNEIENPRSLACNCICAIRRHLVMVDPHGRSIHRSIEKLPLPTELKRQLKLQNTSDIEFSSDKSDIEFSSDKETVCISLPIFSNFEVISSTGRLVRTYWLNEPVSATRRSKHAADKRKSIDKWVRHPKRIQWKQSIKQSCSTRR